MVTWIPNHLNTELLKVWYSNVSVIQMLAIRIPTVMLIYHLKSDNLKCCIFDQRLGAANSKRWSKYFFFNIFCTKKMKSKKKQENGCNILQKKNSFLSLHQNAGRGQKLWKSIFQPAFGVRSTHTLVETYNKACYITLSAYLLY